MQTRIKIAIFTSFLAILGVFAMSMPAFAETFGDRIEIYGKTTVSDLLTNGISNSGVLHFGDNPETIGFAEDDNSYLPLAPEQAAHLMPSLNASGAVEYYELRGWTWSDNLGWVSFYCGADGLNSGAACGAFKYVTRILPDGEAMGDDNWGDDLFFSWAWNQAMGWISMTDANHAAGEIADFIKPGYGLKMDVFRPGLVLEETRE